MHFATVTVKMWFGKVAVLVCVVFTSGYCEMNSSSGINLVQRALNQCLQSKERLVTRQHINFLIKVSCD